MATSILHSITYVQIRYLTVSSCIHVFCSVKYHFVSAFGISNKTNYKYPILESRTAKRSTETLQLEKPAAVKEPINSEQTFRETKYYTSDEGLNRR